MAKAVISIRLEKSVIEALDNVGFAGPTLQSHANRSQLIEAILKLFLEQDFAVQRATLAQALGSPRNRRREDDRSG